jgi:hypothetical protein
MNRPRAALGLSLVALLTASLVLGPGIGQAHTKRYRTTVTATPQNKNLINGQVISIPRCKALRTVTVYSTTGTLEAAAQTDSLGKFQIKDKNLTTGTHAVVLRRKVLLRNRHHKHICRGATTTFVTT